MPEDGTYQQVIVGTCVECAGQMVEKWRSLGGGRGNLGLECQDCGEAGQIEYIIREENPWQNPSVQESLTDPTVKSINWINCPRCHGHGWVKDPICDLRRAMNGRERPCPNCHTEGTVPRVVETDGGRSKDFINRFAFLDGQNGAHIEYEGPFEFARDGASFEVSIPIDPDDYAGIYQTTAENLSERVGDFGVAVADGGIEASGVIEAAEILESTLVVRVDDGRYVSSSDVDIDRSVDTRIDEDGSDS